MSMFGNLMDAGRNLAQAGRYLGQSMRLMVACPSTTPTWRTWRQPIRASR